MPTRFVNAAAETAAGAEHVNYCFLVTLNFTSATVYVFNGLGQLTFNGNVYSGLGELGTISTIGESTDLRPLNPVELQLAGVDPATLYYAEIRSEYYRRSVRIDIALFDSNLQLLTPIENAVWEGWMDTVLIERGDDTATITLTCESLMAIWDRQIGLLYTDEHQRALVSDDQFFDHIADLKNKKLTWGGATVATGGGGGSDLSPGDRRPRPPYNRP